jgi:ribonuclease HII
MKAHKLELELTKKGINLICGLDEAGRGPLAGPVVAAAVILPKNLRLPSLNDSKLLTERKREKLYEKITKNAKYGVGIVKAHEIDEIGILEATYKAFQKALSNLGERPEYLLIDGRDAFFFDIPYLSVVKGDTKVRAIAAASIIAKVHRDRLMVEQQQKHPKYTFRKHKGYGTKAHLKEIEKYGYCEIHRKTFKLKKV